jgi:hypothetical protein
MQGRHVVWGLGAVLVLMTAGIWAAGTTMVSLIDSQADREGVPRLTRQEAAERVAREDRFGLPSRLENPPPRDIEEHRKVGTPAAPLAATEAGGQKLLEVYGVTLELCRKRAKTGHVGVVDLHLNVAERHIDSVTVPDQTGDSWTGFEKCMLGGLRGAVFASDGALVVPVSMR